MARSWSRGHGRWMATVRRTSKKASSPSAARDGPSAWTYQSGWRRTHGCSDEVWFGTKVQEQPDASLGEAHAEPCQSVLAAEAVGWFVGADGVWRADDVVVRPIRKEGGATGAAHLGRREHHSRRLPEPVVRADVSQTRSNPSSAIGSMSRARTSPSPTRRPSRADSLAIQDLASISMSRGCRVDVIQVVPSPSRPPRRSAARAPAGRSSADHTIPEAPADPSSLGGVRRRGHGVSCRSRRGAAR